MKTKKITGKIEVVTGLHIGAGNDKIEIGAMDNPIIRDPKTNMPYIPGSSLKGKMRSLLEWEQGLVSKNKGAACSCRSCIVCKIFGVGVDANADKQPGPTRIIVRDAFLTESLQQQFKDGKVFIEEKSENSLNRITAKANPRPIERVVPGTQFDFEIILKILDTDDAESLFKTVKDCLKLLQDDYLGGGGSRGSGKITFVDLYDENKEKIEL